MPSLSNSSDAEKAYGSDLGWQNEFQAKLKRFLDKECKKRNYHAIVSVEVGRGSGFVTSAGTLKPETSFESWRLIVSSLGMAFVKLAQNFNLGVRVGEPPIQPKNEEMPK